jgi:recombinational DNA repair protein RecR
MEEVYYIKIIRTLGCNAISHGLQQMRCAGTTFAYGVRKEELLELVDGATLSPSFRSEKIT